ncbi:MAG TPA: serine protease [Rhodothermales bacterium]|nr:serine protease [Rhodothermales bacterium]
MRSTPDNPIPIPPTVFPKDIDPTAVSIVVDQDVGRPLGTGFYFLQRELFVTAKHVVVDRDNSVRANLVLMQNGPSYPKAEVAFVHPSLDLAVLRIDTPGCTVPLYPSDQRLNGKHGLRYWGYAPTRSDKVSNRYVVNVVEINAYECEPARERDDGVEWLLRFNSDWGEGGHSGGPVLSVGGGVVAVITEGHEGWLRATEIRGLLPAMRIEFPNAG